MTLLGSLDINLQDAQELLTLVGKIPEVLDRYITHRFPLDEIGRAFDTQIDGRCGKILLYPWAGSTNDPAADDPAASAPLVGRT